MKLVNTASKIVHNKYVGFIYPGKVVNGNRDSNKLLAALEEVVKVCGKDVAIILNEREVELINAVMNLDERGGKFDPSAIPEEIRDDPTGLKRSSKRIRDAQTNSIKKMKLSNEQARKREAFINGEIMERKPKGMAAMEGQPVDPSMLKSGFEKILEENAKIAACEKADPNEMLDPVGAHMKRPGEDPVPSADGPYDASGKPAEPLKRAMNMEDDGTRTADAIEPVPQAPSRAGAMDRQAAETARKLAQIGPVELNEELRVPDNVPEKPAARTGRGRGRPSSRK